MKVLPVYSADNRLRLSRQQWIEDLFRVLDYTWFLVLKTENNTLDGLQDIHYG